LIDPAWRVGLGLDVIEYIGLCGRRVRFPVVGESHKATWVLNGAGDAPDWVQKTGKRRLKEVMRPDQSAIYIEFKCLVQL